MDINQDINNWISHLSTKQVLLGGLSVCPFAKNSEYELVLTDPVKRVVLDAWAEVEVYQ